MLTFCGIHLELTVDRVLLRQDGPQLCTAHDTTGTAWLILRTCNTPSHQVWICAPQSPRALQAVTVNPQVAYQAIRHSVTGTAEVVSVQHGLPCPDRCFLGAQLPQYNPTDAQPTYTVAA
jgi:hypothetical protein